MASISGNAPIILASASPRRRRLLALTGWEAVVYPVDVDEQPRLGESGKELAQRLALEKAILSGRHQEEKGILLGADTVVVDGDRVIGKPADAAEAKEMLMDLRGRSHRVITAIVLMDQQFQRQVFEVCETIVPMREYDEDEVKAYVATGAPLDKAGGYGIQDDSFRPVIMDRLHDCYANVMGLPLCHLVRIMRILKRQPPVEVPEACQTYTGYTCLVYVSILMDQK